MVASLAYRAKSFVMLLGRLGALVVVVLVATSGVAAAQELPFDERFGAVDAYLDPNAAVESRVGWERITFDWNLLQPAPGSPIVTAALQEEWFTDARDQGREVVGMLVNTPEWATNGRPLIGVPSGLYLDTDDPGNVWADYVRRVVSTYASRGVNHWIIWDNPNIPSRVYGHGWEGSIEDYYQMVKVAYVVAREVNPEAQIHLAGYSQTYDAQWLGKLMEVAAADESAAENNYYFDAATLHFYYEVEDVITGVSNAFLVMQQNGISKDLWIVEAGGYPPDIALEEYPTVTPEQDASYIIQATALGLSAGVQRVGVSRFVDAQDEDGELLPGLLAPNGNPHPAYEAYRVVTERFAGARAASRTELELVHYVKIRQSDAITHVAWAHTAQPALLSIPASTTSATLVDQTGVEVSVSPTDGRYQIRLEGANCNAPNGGCPIGGPVMVLVETGIDPFVDPTPSAPLQEALAPTLSPSEVTSTPPPSPTPAPTASPAPAGDAAPVEPQPTEVAVEVPAQEPTQAPVPTATFAPAVPTPIPPPPTGLAAVVPFLMVGLGMLLVGGGVGFWLRDRRLRMRERAPGEDDAPAGGED